LRGFLCNFIAQSRPSRLLVQLIIHPHHHNHFKFFVMKRTLIFGGVALVALVSFAMMHRSTKKHPAANGGFAVVELFTSEGCSSCPPADAAMAKLLDEYKENVFALGFHVDYWNRLGWQDVYSNGAFTARQLQYSNVLHLKTIYTPQAIVNGRVEFTGSDNSKLHTAVDAGLAAGNGESIQLSATGGDNNVINVSYQLQASAGNTLNVALIQLHARSDVKSGENSGRQLQHVNVVRAFNSIPVKETTGQLTLTLPQGLDAGGCRVIAYLQDAKTFKVLGAVAAGISK